MGMTGRAGLGLFVGLVFFSCSPAEEEPEPENARPVAVLETIVAPVEADCGPDSTVPMLLDGTNSSDADAGDSLTFNWSILPGSGVDALPELVDVADSNGAIQSVYWPINTGCLAGDVYDVRLAVTDDSGESNATSESVRVSFEVQP